MAQFSYRARRRTGEVVEGILEVADRSAALVQIERLGLFPVAVDAARGSAIAAALVEVLRRMADHFERFATVQSKFTSALIYPAFVSTVGVAIAFFFMSYMLPKFMTIFEGMNVPLPMMTQILVGISHFFAGYWWLMVSIVIVTIILFKRFQATENGRLRIDQWKMRAPVVGKVVRL